MERGDDSFQSSVDGVGWDRIVIEASGEGRWDGLSVQAIADARSIEPVEACFDLLEDDPETSCIGHAMDERDVRTIMADPDIMVASDAIAMSPDGPLGTVPVHPRNYGTFPRVLGPYVRDGVLGLEAAVRKMTSSPAERFGLRDRGRLVEGAYADLVVLDPATIRDIADFGAPHAFPEGIKAVVVNGVVAWDTDRAEHARSLRSRAPLASVTGDDPRSHRAGSPEPRVVVAGVGLCGGQPVHVANVGRHGQQDGVAISQDLLAEQHIVGPHVGQGPVVPVLPIDIELQPHVGAVQ